MKKYDRSSIMKAAWAIFRKGVASFAVALRMAWANAKTHNTAKVVAVPAREDIDLPIEEHLIVELYSK